MKAWTILILLSGLFPYGCGESEQDADAIIKLVADPALNSEQEVAGQLATIEMLFDAQEGFERINENNPKADGFAASDVDGDGEAELLLTMSVRGRNSLPKVGLDAGSNRETPIAVRVRGLDPDGEVAALGGIDPRVLFSAAGRNEVEVPFNLSRAHLPHQIVAVAPLSVPRGGVLKSIAFFASRPLDDSSLLESVSVKVLSTGGDGEEEVTGTTTGTGMCPFGTWMYIFTPADCHLSNHWLTGVKLDVGGVSATISIDQVKEFGPCAPETNCEEIGIASAEDTDVTCDRLTGLFEPAPCSVAPAGCRGAAVFDRVRAADTPECQAYRADTIQHDGECVVTAPWPCSGPDACINVGTGTCGGNGQCVPDPCTDTCTPESLACVPTQGCLPKMGGCAQDCQAYGACPEFDQECVLGESGGHVCR
jgi:hypothetical protein